MQAPAAGRPGRGERLRSRTASRVALAGIGGCWVFVDEFPMTVTAKVQKFKMREASVAELGLRAAADARTA